MHLYVLVPLIACIAHAFITGIVFVRDPNNPANRHTALFSAGMCFWAFCEVLWNLSDDPDRVLTLVRVSALGWIWIGPLVYHIFVNATEEDSPSRLRLIRFGYLACASLLAVTWTTPWMHTGVERTEWGWAYHFGPAYVVFYTIAISGLAAGLWTGIRFFRRFASPGERSQGGLILGGISLPLVIASLTDGLLPYFGIQVPRFGTLALALFGVMIAWSFYRFGYSLLAPGRFAPEILEALADGVILVRMNGHIRRVNHSMSVMLGRAPETLVGQRLNELLPFVPLHPPRELDGVEGELVTGAGRGVPVAVSTSLLCDKLGQALGMVLVVRDLRDMVSLRHRLITSARLAAVGELAAGIAHEINNPIAYVRSNLNVLRDHWQTLVGEFDKVECGPALDEILSEGNDLIEESLEGVDRAAAIVRDVKGFSHAGGGERQRIAVSTLLDSVLRVAGPQIRSLAEIEKDYEETPLVSGAPQELQQVFLNLVLNAAQAVAPHGTIRIRCETVGPSVVVRVQDDGCGVPPDAIDRIFDPFFTTKPVGKGTGLGLAISYQIVRNHGGEIGVRSEVGAGTEFSVYLPRVPAD